MTLRLKHFLRLQYGSALASDERLEGDVVVYGSNGSVGWHSTANTLSPAIIVGRKGSHGKVTWAADGGFCIDTALYVDRLSCRGNLRYTFYLLQTLGLEEPSKDSAVPGLDRFDVHNKPIPDIDPEAQNSIAVFLDRETTRIDQLIDKRARFLKLVEERKAALVVQAINGLFLDSKADGVEGWFGRLPKGWPVRRTKFLFRERRGKSQFGEEELLTVSHITGVTKRSEKNVNMFLAESMEGYKLVSQGDAVVNTMWAWMGAMGISPVDGLISPSYGVYEPITASYEPEYLDLLLRSEPYIAEVNRRSKGVWSSRLRLYPAAFLDILLPVPPKESQQLILKELHAATRREDQLARLSGLSLDRLKEFRSALITAAVTGQIDVRAWKQSDSTEPHVDLIEQMVAGDKRPTRRVHV